MLHQTATLHAFGSIDLDEWRSTVRAFVLSGASPDRIEWIDPTDPQGTLHEAPARPPPLASTTAELSVPREFLTLARHALCHKNSSKWPLLYRILWRLTRGDARDRRLLANLVDDDVLSLNAIAKAVRRDAHKMKAFVRFRRVVTESGDEHFVAYHRPEHPIVRLVAPFFARRFAIMRWTILTPYGSASWNGDELSFGPAVARDQAPTADTLEDYWKTYYASIFNPARINPRAMSREMPKKYWSTLPEAAIIEELLAAAPARTDAMIARSIGVPVGGASPFIPAIPTDKPSIALRTLAAAAPSCRGCDLYKSATQVVFGHGPSDARLVLVGEQPGDKEDLAGLPFVGPAGVLLSDALRDAGIDRSTAYLTNAVKHFKWTPEPRGKRRIHSKPSVGEVRACKPWLEHELGLIKPQVLVLLGATAAQSLFGAGFRVTQRRGQIIRDSPFAPAVIATIHPSAVLRAPAESRAEMFAGLVSDLRIAEQLLALHK